MVQTIKFSEFVSGGTTVIGDVVAGIEGGLNTIFTTPLQFVANFTTVTRPTSPVNPTIGYNTTENAFDYWNGTTWLTFDTTADLLAFIARLAAHTPGDGASLVGLQDQSGVTTKTVQDLANAKFLVNVNNGSLQNAQALGSLTTGILKSTTGTGIVSISPGLTSIDALSTAADETLYLTGVNTYATTPLTAFARTLISDTDAPSMRSTLGLGSASTHDINFFLQVASNLSDLSSVVTARSNLGLGTAALKTATSNSETYVTSAHGSFTVGHVLLAADTLGTVKDGGSPAGMGTVLEVDTGAGLTGGPITTTGTIQLQAIADHTVLANISGGSLAPSSTTVTALIDNAIGNTQGDILYRNSTVWTALAPGTSGQVLTTQGAAANPQWSNSAGTGTVNAGVANQLAYYPASAAAVSGNANATIVNGALTLGVSTSVLGTLGLSGNTSGIVTIQPQATAGTYNFNMPTTAGTSGQVLTSQGGVASAMTWTTPTTGTVTSVATSNGITGGTITSTGTVSLASIADHTLLANISGGSTFPSSTTLTALIDNAIGSTQGNILYRNSTAWTVLAPGTSGQFLQTLGAAANVQWAPGDGAGTVTSVATNNGLTGGTITASGTIGLATIATLTGLVNITGGAAVPIANTLTAWIDAAMGSVQGELLYRNGSVWTVLPTGASGQVLQAKGAAANLAYSTATYPVTAGTSGNVLTSDGTNFVSSAPATSGTVTSVATAGLATGGAITSTGTVTVTAAVETDQETGTSTTVAVTPGVQKYHPSACKAWATIVVTTGTPALTESYNFGSVTDNGVGNYQPNFTVALSTGTYSISGMSDSDSGIGYGVTRSSSTTTAINLFVRSTITNVATDEPARICVFGDI